MQYLSIYCTLTLHHVIECTPKHSELSVQYRRTVINKKISADVGMFRQVTKEVMICIDNKYGLIKFTNFYQINHNFSYISTKTSYVTGSILNWVVWLQILHTLTREAVSSFFVRI